MNKDYKTRLGVNNIDEIKNHEFFSNIDWKELYKKNIKPPVDFDELKNEVIVNYFK